MLIVDHDIKAIDLEAVVAGRGVFLDVLGDVRLDAHESLDDEILELGMDVLVIDALFGVGLL